MYVALVALVALLAFIGIFCKFRERSSNILFVIIVCAIISVLLAYRSIEIPDTYEYIRIFNGIDINTNYGFSLFADNYQFGVEYGYIYLIEIFKRFISTDYHVFFTAISFTIQMLLVYGSLMIIRIVNPKEKDDNNALLVLTIVISYFGLYYCGIAIRAGLAIGITLFSLGYAIRKNYVKAFICLLLAMLFHRLSIIVIIVYLIYILFPRFKKKTFITIWFVLGGLLVLRFPFYVMSFSNRILSFIASKFATLNYLRYTNNLETNISVYAFILWLIGLICCLIIYDKEIYAEIFNIYMAGNIITVFLAAFSGYSRITDFFTIMNVPLLYFVVRDRKQVLSINSVVVLLVIGLNVYKVLTVYTH